MLVYINRWHCIAIYSLTAVLQLLVLRFSFLLFSFSLYFPQIRHFHPLLPVLSVIYRETIIFLSCPESESLLKILQFPVLSTCQDQTNRVLLLLEFRYIEKKWCSSHKFLKLSSFFQITDLLDFVRLLRTTVNMTILSNFTVFHAINFTLVLYFSKYIKHNMNIYIINFLHSILLISAVCKTKSNTLQHCQLI